MKTFLTKTALEGTILCEQNQKSRIVSRSLKGRKYKTSNTKTKFMNKSKTQEQLYINVIVVVDINP
jgi:hypothetical protein